MDSTNARNGRPATDNQKPLIFISHKHADRALATVIRGFISERSSGNIEVYQSSDADAPGPRAGRGLHSELTLALWRARILILIYTAADRDWSLCTWECGVATNPASPETRIIVFHCGTDDVPSMFHGQVHVNVRQELDVRRFVVDYMTAADFLPGRTIPITAFHPAQPEVVRAAESLFKDLNAVLPEVTGTEKLVHPFLQLQLPSDAVKALENIKPGEQIGAARVEAARATLLSEATVSDCGSGVARLFGMAELPLNTRLQTMHYTWRSASTDTDEDDRWLQTIAEQVSRATHAEAPTVRFAALHEPGSPTLHAPILVRHRKVPYPPATQFDFHLIPWREAGLSRASDRDHALFAHVFGELAVSDGMTAVFPSARPVTEKAADGTFRNRGIYYPNPPANAHGAEPKQIQYVVPLEDMNASTQLAEMCQRVGVQFRTELDTSYANPSEPIRRESLIALGLGFNHLTARLSRLTSLFHITYPEGTDDFEIGGVAHGFPKNGDDCALLARIVVQHSTRRLAYFVCAGRTAAGTLSAGCFLAHRWKDFVALYQDAGKDLHADSVALLLRFAEGAADAGEIEGVPFFAKSRS